MGRLLRNAAKCGNCGAIVESKHRHDFMSCECGDIFVDGGLAYHRYGFVDGRLFIDLSEWADEPPQ